MIAGRMTFSMFLFLEEKINILAQVFEIPESTVVVRVSVGLMFSCLFGVLFASTLRMYDRELVYRHRQWLLRRAQKSTEH